MKTTRPSRYDLNQIPHDYIVEVTNRFKGLDLIDKVPEELWIEVQYSGLISFRTDWFDLLAVQGTLKSFLLCCWKRVFAMTSTFSWQNSIRLCPASGPRDPTETETKNCV